MLVAGRAWPGIKDWDFRRRNEKFWEWRRRRDVFFFFFFFFLPVGISLSLPDSGVPFQLTSTWC